MVLKKTLYIKIMPASLGSKRLILNCHLSQGMPVSKGRAAEYQGLLVRPLDLMGGP